MAAQDAENAAAFFLYLQTGRVAKPTGRTDQPAVTVPTETQPTTVFTFPTAPLEDGPLSFAASDLEGIEIKNGSTYEPDFGALLEAPVSLDFSGEEPRILIIHTHATESYTMEPGWGVHRLLGLPNFGPGIQHDPGRGRPSPGCWRRPGFPVLCMIPP